MAKVFSEAGKFDLYEGDLREVLPKEFEKRSVHCCLTSPPYWQQRDYGNSDQIGNETTAEGYIFNLCQSFDAVRDVLRDDGTLWVNIGDRVLDGNVMNIPFLFAENMKQHGWYQRQWFPWLKRNSIPRGGSKKPNDNLEVIFMFSKHKSEYYYDQVAAKEQAGLTTRLFRNGDSIVLEPEEGYWVFDVPTRKNWSEHFSTFPPLLAEIIVRAGTSDKGVHPSTRQQATRIVKKRRYSTRSGTHSKKDPTGKAFRDIGRHLTEITHIGWECDTSTEDYDKPIVLDPFMGMATAGVACMTHGRFFKGIELNGEYLQECNDRLLKTSPVDIFEDKG